MAPALEKIHAQVAEQARKLYVDAIAVGLVRWPQLDVPDKAAAQARAGGLPAEVALVVTPTFVFASGYRSGLGGVKLKEELGAFPRNALRVHVSFPTQDPSYARVDFATPDKRFQLDAPDAVGVNRDFIASLRTE